MKKILVQLLGFAQVRLGLASASSHDDTLRANQGDPTGPGFSFWRALVS